MHFVIIGIIIITSLISLNLMNNEEQKEKWLFHPYRCKHNKETYRIFSHMFVHADISHLLFNMMSLYFLGSFLEEQFVFWFGVAKGELHILSIYILGGLASTIWPYIRNHENYNYRALGASGAVSAIVFAFIVLNPTQNLYFMFIPVPIPAYLFGIGYLALEYFLMKKGGTGVAHDAHIGGAILGIVYILLINFEYFYHLIF